MVERGKIDIPNTYTHIYDRSLP